MALPITIFNESNGVFLAPCGGPFKRGTSFYIGAVLTSSGIDVYKADSDDPSSGWTVQDQSNNATGTTNAGLHSVPDGTLIHVVTQENSASGTDVLYSIFNTSANTWSTTDESVTTAPDGGTPFCSIAVRSDGDIIAAYQGAQEANMGTGYDRVDLARRESGTWTADISVDNLGKTTTHMRYPFVVMSANDRAHISYHDASGQDVHYSTYLSGNTWGHQHTEVDAAASGVPIPAHVAKGFRFDDGGTEKIRFFYRDSPTTDLSVFGFDDADDPGSSVSIATDINSSGNNLIATSGTAVVVDDSNDTQYYLHSDETSGDIQFNSTGSGDDTWGTAEDELASLSNPTVFSANVYDNGGTVLAYLYKDGSNYRYNERSLGAGTVYQGTGTAATTVTATAAATRTVGAATGTAAFDIDATADALGLRPASGTAAFNIDATANANRAATGAGTAAFDVDATADGTRIAKGDATAAFEIDATADATRSVGAATGTAAFDVDASADATRTVGAASGTASFDVDMSAAASAAKSASATAAFDVDATAAATRTVGAATGTMAFDIDATADATRQVGAASGTMSLEVDISADGFRYLKGDATAAFDIDAVADATIVAGGTVFEGTGTAAFDVDATADGTRFAKGDATAAFDVDAAADATRTVGAASGTAAFDVDASADATRLVGAATGTMAFNVDMSAAASAAKSANAGVSIEIDATAAATRSTTGTATAAFDVDATGAATRTVGDASATAAITVDLSADATRSVFGSATAAFDIDVTADATVEAPGTVFEGSGTAAFDVDMSASPAAVLFATASSEINIDMSAVATGGAAGVSRGQIPGLRTRPRRKSFPSAQPQEAILAARLLEANNMALSLTL